jgi:XTP/dITP diphosphohydrolase
VKRLLIATNNPGKVEEFRDLLSGCGWEIIAPSDVNLEVDVEENGTTYAENATLKAQAFARASDLAALADDSGLEVDALNGDPGALHHLNGWDGSNQAERIEILMKALDGKSQDERNGRFRSVIVLVRPGEEPLETEGVVEGNILTRSFGANGFGYDPVFYLPELGCTMAQLTTEQKNGVSHRGIAANKMRSLLQRLAAEE